MKQSKTTLKELTAAYRAVLRHGILCNAIALGLIAATPAHAETLVGVAVNGDPYHYITDGSTLNLTDSSYTSFVKTGGSGNARFGSVAHSGGGSTINVTDSDFTGNTNDYVGGVLATGLTGTLSVTGSTFSNNHAHYDGGAIGNYGGLTITNSTFSGNTAHYDADGSGNYTVAVADSTPIGGGAISLGAVSSTTVGSISDTTFENNRSGTNGGAIGTRLAQNADNHEAKLDIEATFTGNEALQNGGAIYNTFYANNGLGKGDGVTVSGNFTENSAGSKGGAIYNDGTVDNGGLGNAGGVMTVFDSTFTNNTATLTGGSINNAGGLMTLLNTVFTKNQVFGTSTEWGEGGAINNAGTMTVTNAVFGGEDENGNIAERGGAINNASGTITVNNAEFTNNVASNMGGAINADAGTVIVNDSEFTGNNGGIYGGAIASVFNTVNKIEINDSEFTSNRAQLGGAIAAYQTLEVTDSTFTNNQTTVVEDGGGAIVLGGHGKATITGTTFNGNKSNLGGAIATRPRGANAMGDGAAAGNEDGHWMVIEDSIFTNNVADATLVNAENGAIHTYGGHNMYNGDGGAIWHGFEGSTVGGVVHNNQINGSQFTLNIAKNNGGAIYNEGNLILTDDTFTNNSADGLGGAIYNNADGVLTVAAENADVTFSGNTANGEANDIYNIGTLTLNAASGHSISLAGGITGALESIASNIVNITGAGNVSVDNTLINQTVNNSGNLSLNADLTGTTITNAEGSTITLARDIAFEGGENTLDGYNGELTNNITVADGAALTINNATFASGDGDLVNEQGGVLRINDSLVGVNVTNHGTLISDPTTYSNTVTNTGIASFDDDTFTGTAELANTGTVSLANGVTFESGATITGAGVTNLTGGYTHFNDTANANTINVVSGANFDGLVIGGTINTQNGMIDAIAGSIQDADVALDVDTNSLTTDTFADASNSTIKSLNVFGAYGNSGTATIAMAPGMSLADDAVINGGYYTSVTANGGNIVFGDKLMNTSGLYAQLGSWSGDIIGTSSTYDSETNSYTNTGTTVGAALAALETAVNGKQDTIVNSATIVANGTGGFDVAAGSIGATQLAANSVASSNIIDGSIVNDDIAAGTITTDRLASQNVSQFTNDAGYQNATQVSDAITAALANGENAYQTASDVATTLGAYSTTDQMNTAISNALANGENAYQTASDVAATLSAYSTTAQMNEAIANNTQNATYTSGTHADGTIGKALDNLNEVTVANRAKIEELIGNGANSIGGQIAAATTMAGDDDPESSLYSNFAEGASVTEAVTSLDNAIGTTITDGHVAADNTVGQNLNSLNTALVAVESNIGTTSTGTHVTATNSVGTNINNLDTALATAEANINLNTNAITTLNADENTDGSVRNIAKSYFDLAAQSDALTLSEANAYTDKRIEKLDKDLSAGIASAVALSSVAVSDVRRGELSVGAGYGYFNGQSAGAFGAAMGISNRWSVNAGAGISGYDVSFRAGTNYKFKLF